MIDELTIKRVTEAASILDVMREFEGERLKKCGSYTWTMPCPLHGGRSLGHFKVNERDNYAHCFSCGESVDAVGYLMKVQKFKFSEAIQWLGAKYGIFVEGSENYHPKPSQPYVPLPPLLIVYMPQDYPVQGMANNDKNTLLKWVRSLNWNSEQRARVEKRIKNYAIGTYIDSKWGTEYTMFWYISHIHNVCTAKLMRYNADGHRNKEKYSTDWYHSKQSVARGGKFDDEKMAIDKIVYFGNHLLPACPDATVNIVESEKTALLCSIYFGEPRKWVWIACGGKQNLTREKMQPLIDQNRTIILYPDKDGAREWQNIAKAINYKKLHVNMSFMSDNWLPEDGPKADIADIIVRKLTPQPSDIDKAAEMFPDTLGYLIDNLKLELE